MARKLCAEELRWSDFRGGVYILADFVAEMCNALVAVSFVATPLATYSHSVSVRIALVFNALS